jgi:short-subunit dehydrogenase
MTSFYDRYGPWAVIAGGSQGLGAAFAEQLAEQGFNLMLSARNAEVLDAFAAELRGRWPAISVKTVAADLSTTPGVDALIDAAAGLEVGFFIHNAGTGTKMQPFLDLPFQYHADLMSLNAVSMLKLVYHFAPPMVHRGRGGMVIVGSLAGVGGQYGLTTYSAVKSFSRVFCEGFWFEMKQRGVNILALTPGGIETPSRQRDFPQVSGTGMASGDVAREALANITKGPVYFPGPNAEKARAIRALDFDQAVEEAYSRNAAFRGEQQA